LALPVKNLMLPYTVRSNQTQSQLTVQHPPNYLVRRFQLIPSVIGPGGKIENAPLQVHQTVI